MYPITGTDSPERKISIRKDWEIWGENGEVIKVYLGELNDEGFWEESCKRGSMGKELCIKVDGGEVSIDYKILVCP